jgi:hypothetical protein
MAMVAGAATLAALSASSLGPHLTGASDGSFAERKDIIQLPQPLKDRLVALSQTQSTFPPAHAFNEAVTAAGVSIPSQLFQYYLLDNKNFQPNVFTQANGDSLGATRVVLEPKTGRPTDPGNVNAAIDTFADFVGLPVINNEAGFYESWMIHDVVVAAQPFSSGRSRRRMRRPSPESEMATMSRATSSPWMATLLASGALAMSTQTPPGSPMSSRSRSVSEPLTPLRRTTPTTTGSSIPARTGSSPSTRFPSPVAGFRATWRSSTSGSRSSLEAVPRVSRTPR